MSDTQYVLSLSYGKDSLACLGAIEELGWPLDRIVHAEVWATDEIPADLPPMVEFKSKADAIIKERWGIEVEHVCAMKDGEKLTYEKIFYRAPKRKSGGAFEEGTVSGFPYQKGAWCNDRLKTNVLDQVSRGGGLYMASQSSEGSGAVQCSKSERYGWATKWKQYCTGELKRDVLQKTGRSATGFPKAPGRGAVQISCSTLESQQTSRIASEAFQKRRKVHSSRLDGTKPSVANGARKMDSCPRYIPRQQEADVGSAITKALVSFGCSERTTRIYGR